MAKKHTHKYHRVGDIGNQLWACALPDCNHFMPKHYEMMLPGKTSICWECGETFILTHANMKDSQPKCPDCSVEMGSLATMLDERVP